MTNRVYRLTKTIRRSIHGWVKHSLQICQISDYTSNVIFHWQKRKAYLHRCCEQQHCQELEGPSHSKHAEETLWISEVVATVKSRIQEMSRECLYHMGQDLTGVIYSRNRVHVKLTWEREVQGFSLLTARSETEIRRSTTLVLYSSLSQTPVKEKVQTELWQLTYNCSFHPVTLPLCHLPLKSWITHPARNQCERNFPRGVSGGT